MKSKDYKVVKENDQPIAHCLTHRKLDSCPILRFSNGRIEVKNPNEQAIKKLCTLASKLKLNLVGDDGEKYKLGWFGRVQTIG